MELLYFSNFSFKNFHKNKISRIKKTLVFSFKSGQKDLSSLNNYPMYPVRFKNEVTCLEVSSLEEVLHL